MTESLSVTASRSATPARRKMARQPLKDAQRHKMTEVTFCVRGVMPPVLGALKGGAGVLSEVRGGVWFRLQPPGEADMGAHAAASTVTGFARYRGRGLLRAVSQKCLSTPRIASRLDPLRDLARGAGRHGVEVLPLVARFSGSGPPSHHWRSAHPHKLTWYRVELGCNFAHLDTEICYGDSGIE